MKRLYLVSYLILKVLILANFSRADIPVVWQQSIAEAGRGGTPLWSKIACIPDSNDVGIVDCYVGDGSYQLHYAQGHDNSWTRSVIGPTNGDRPGLSITPAGVPYVSFQLEGGSQIVAYSVSMHWDLETVVETGAGGGSSVAFDPISGEPAVAFGGSGSISYAYRNAGVWYIEQISSGFGTHSEPSLAFDPISHEATVAYSHTFQGPMFARRSSSGWTTDLITSVSFPGDTVLAYSPTTGLPGIAYMTGLFGVPIYLSEWDGHSWNIEGATMNKTAGDQFGFAYSSKGLPVIAYTPEEPGKSVEVIVRGIQGYFSWSEFTTNSWTFGVDIDLKNDMSNISYLTGDTYYAFPDQAVPPPQPATLLLLTPNGEQELIADSDYLITWETEGVAEHIFIEYSVDNGTNWIPIDTVANAGSYEWKVPRENSSECVVRIRDAAYPNSNDKSDSVFRIYVCTLNADLNHDCFVNFLDFAFLSSEWLQCGDPCEPTCQP